MTLPRGTGDQHRLPLKAGVDSSCSRMLGAESYTDLGGYWITSELENKDFESPNMLSPTIFYSWQSDLPNATTRGVISKALSQSMKLLESHPSIVDSPRLDQDTQNVGGTPEIASTILRKIERAAVFVADVSICSQTTEKCANRKYSPNANVMLETGYAAARLGWDRIVLVMNDRFGGPTKLPFDLRNRRWPITFSTTESNLESSMPDLVTQLNEQVGLSLAADYARAEDALSQLAPHARRLIRRLALASTFNDGKAENNLLSRDDFNTQQMINLGLIQVTPDSTDLRFKMAWTYLGRECCRRLGVEIPVQAESPQITSLNNVFVDVSSYDSLLLGRDSYVSPICEQTTALEPAAEPVSNEKSSPSAQ